MFWWTNTVLGFTSPKEIATSDVLPLVVRRTQSTLSSIVAVHLPGKQERQGSIPCEGDYSFVQFCCHSITLLLSHNRNIIIFSVTHIVNCFHFDFPRIASCPGRAQCESSFYMFQDLSGCPISKIYTCMEYYYSARCQFTNKVLTFSLDVILG